MVCLGYKGYVIKEYFANYFLHMSNVTFDIQYNTMEVHHRQAEPWKVTLVDTGEDTMTGGRIKRVREYLGNDDFCCTYGDGVSNVDIKASIDFHKKHGKLATVTAIQPRDAMAPCKSKMELSKHFRKNRLATATGSMAAFCFGSALIDKYIAGDATLLNRNR